MTKKAKGLSQARDASDRGGLKEPSRLGASSSQKEGGGPTRHRPARENKHRWQRDWRILETWGTQPGTGNGGQLTNEAHLEKELSLHMSLCTLRTLGQIR